MGVIQSLLGRSTADTDTVEPASKYAILLNTGPDDPPRAGNAFNYALELDDAGFEVAVYLDGAATKWPGAFAEESARPFSYEWEAIRERGLLVGACGYCANAFEAAQACTRSEVSLLSGSGEHAPSIAALADDGYDLLTV